MALVVCLALDVRHVEWFAEALLDGVLDDFTRADLSHTDLSGLDLTGVRWSVSGTEWPPGTDVDELRAQSQEVGTGTYVITQYRGEGNKANHHAPASL